MAYFQIPLHHSLLSTALNPRSPLAKEKTGSSSKDAQIPLDVSCLSTSSGQIGLGARGEHKSSLSTACHSLPNRPKLVAAQLLSREFVSWLQNLWCMHQTGWLKAQASLQLLDCYMYPPMLSQLGYLECMAFTGCPQGPPLSTPYPVRAQRYAPKCQLGTFTRMHCVRTKIQA